MEQSTSPGTRVTVTSTERTLVLVMAAMMAGTPHYHHNDVRMSAMASQITGVSIVCSTNCYGADQRKHQSSVSLAFVKGIHQWPVDSLHNEPVTRMFSFDDVIMIPNTYRIMLFLPMALAHKEVMITSSNGNIFRVTDPLSGEFTGHRWIPHTKASDAELWYFLWTAPE